ncbi:MAG: 3-methyl-2-oxobutanoate hydroxymethyltransferase [Wolinella sp.]
MKSVTIPLLQKKKHTEKITMLTAYDSLMARLFDSEVDILLVGDSLAMSFGGHDDTLGVGIDEMIYHTRAVARHTRESLVVLDMPFGSYDTQENALKNAIRAYKEGGADAIKLEGGIQKAGIVTHLVDNGIAVMGHIGLKPQFVRAEGGYKIKGRTQEQQDSLLKDAKALQESGAFALVLEGVVASVAEAITKELTIPTIGIGSGAKVDGQVLVWSDMLGLFEEFKPKFVRRYLDGADLVRQSVRAYVKDVKEGRFPDSSESY